MLKKDRLLIAQLLFFPPIVWFITLIFIRKPDGISLLLAFIVASFYIFLFVQRLVEDGIKFFSLEDTEKRDK